MKPVSDMKYHPLTEDLVKVLCNQTQNFNPKIFRLMLSYYLAKVASMMRCSIQTLDRGPIGLNLKNLYLRKYHKFAHTLYI
jgi:hypothetical protein